MLRCAADGLHALHDGLAILVDRRDRGLAEDTLGGGNDDAANTGDRGVGVAVDGKIHLPGHVVGEIDLVGRVPHGHLVELAVGEADGGRRGNDLEGGVLGLVGEEAALIDAAVVACDGRAARQGVGDVLGALCGVGRCRVLIISFHKGNITMD